MTNTQLSQTPLTYTQWSQLLQTKINESSHNESCVWQAVIDPSADEQLPALLWELEEQPDIWPLFMNTMLQRVSLNGPLFLQFKAQSKISAWFFKQSQYKALGVLYEVEKTKVSTLFNHLQNLLECTFSDGKSGVFRFSDPRVLYALNKFENKSWREQASGSCVALHAWDPGRAEAVQIRGSGRILEQEGLLIEETLLEFIAVYNAPYFIINNMQGENGEKLRSLPLPEAFSLVNELCSVLLELGLRTSYDLLTGTSLAMQGGVNIFQHKIVRESIKAKAKDETLVAVIRRLPRQLLNELDYNLSY